MKAPMKTRMKTGIGIFTKTPGLSPIKTRLAREIGAPAAEQFYLLSLKATEAIVWHACAKDSGLVASWAIAEPRFLPEFWNQFRKIQTAVHQAPEGLPEGRDAPPLGERLAHVYEQLHTLHGSVILMGADSPLLAPVDILHAAEDLRAHRGFSMAPSADGGFVLFCGALGIPREAWARVAYSTPRAAQELEASLGQDTGQACRKLPLGADVDTLEDLSRLVEQHRGFHNSPLLPEQVELLEWSEKLLANPVPCSPVDSEG
jgi:glycosyltransferase A (GT-A) superfamily protein (DUF2064 family)